MLSKNAVVELDLLPGAFSACSRLDVGA